MQAVFHKGVGSISNFCVRKLLTVLINCVLVSAAAPGLARGQPRAADGVTINELGEPQYATFSLCAIDPATGQSGAGVTTRVPFVGRAVPHVRAGVGAVCTQASTMVEYGVKGLDLMAKGVEPKDAIAQLLAADEQRESRQLGMIDMKGRSAAHTGKNNGNWAGSRQGRNYTVQANIMVGPEVVEAVAATFEATEGTGLPLATATVVAFALVMLTVNLGIALASRRLGAEPREDTLPDPSPAAG